MLHSPSIIIVFSNSYPPCGADLTMALKYCNRSSKLNAAIAVDLNDSVSSNMKWKLPGFNSVLEFCLTDETYSNAVSRTAQELEGN